MLAWILAAIDLYLMVRSPRPVAVGLFVLPLVLALVVMAGPMTAPQQADWAAWGGVTAFWGIGAWRLPAGAGRSAPAWRSLAGLMYLVQSRRLKQKRPAPFGFALPSLEQSERLNRGAITARLPAADVRPADRRGAGPGARRAANACG